MFVMFEDHVSIELKIRVMGTDSPDSEQLTVRATNFCDGGGDMTDTADRDVCLWV